MSERTTITPPRVPIIDPRTGLITREWYQFFLAIFRHSGMGGTANQTTNDLSQDNLSAAQYHEEDESVNQSAILAEYEERIEALELRGLGTYVDFDSPPPFGRTTRAAVRATTLDASGPFGCNNKSAQSSVTVNAASTDLATVVALCNQLRVALIANGITV